MNNSAELFKYTIAAGATQAVNATGTKLFVRTALQPFTVKFDTGAQIEIEDGFRYTTDKQFTRLQVTNNNAAALLVEFYVSDATVERDAPLYIREALTTVDPASLAFDLALSAISPVFNAAPLGKHRKEFVIGNRSPTAGNNLEILVGGVAVAFVPPTSSFVFPSNDAFQIQNAGVGSIHVYLMALNYAN